MLAQILRRELREHLTSFRFAGVFTLVLLLMTTSVLVFSAEYGDLLRDYPRRISSLVDEQGQTNLASVPCQGGHSVIRMPSPLAFCAGAGDRELPDQAGMAIHGLRWLARRGQLEGLLGGATHLDWTSIVAVLLSFAAGLLTYRSIAGELQDGTLALVLSNPVSRATVLLGKYLAALLTLGAALALAAVSSLILLRLTATVDLATDQWLELGFAGMTSLLYLSCFVLIGLLCSILSRNSTIAAMTFLFAWAFLVFVVPNLGGMLAGQLGTVRTPRQIRSLSEGIPDRLPLTPGMSPQEKASVRVDRELAGERLLVEHAQELMQQVRLGQDLTRISPTSTFSFAVEEVTGGGLPRLQRFIDNAVRFRQGVFQAILEADREDPQSEHRYVPWNCGSDNFSRRTVDLGPAKEFRDPSPSSAEGLQAASVDLALLILYNGVLFLAAFRAFVRQDITPGSAL
jgi:hypothetical protein